MAQSVECLTLDFGSGHDLAVRGFEPLIGLCADSAESAWDSFSSSLFVPPRFHSKINKLIKKKKTHIRDTCYKCIFSSSWLAELEALWEGPPGLKIMGNLQERW